MKRIASILASNLLITTYASAVPLQDLTHLDGSTAAYSHSKPKELVIFWATWCPDCRKKLIDELPAKKSNPTVEVVTINTEKDIPRVKNFIEKNKMEFTVLSDPKNTLRKSLKIFSVPAWAVYEKNIETGAYTNLVASGSAFETPKINEALGFEYLK